MEESKIEARREFSVLPADLDKRIFTRLVPNAHTHVAARDSSGTDEERRFQSSTSSHTARVLTKIQMLANALNVVRT